MEIDDNLKNRLAGVAVVTVLAVIFLPMLFDDPVEKKGQLVSELDIPHKPEVSPSLKTAIIPDKVETVVNQPQIVPVNSTAKETEELPADTPGLSSSELNVEKPSLTPEPITEESVAVPAQPKKVAKAVEVENPPAKIEKKPTPSTLPKLDEEYQEQTPAKTPPSLPAPAGNHRWMIQVASLSDESKAIALRDKLRSQGFPATISEAVVKGKRTYRLKVGPELDKERAQAMKTKINQLNNVKSIAIAE